MKGSSKITLSLIVGVLNFLVLSVKVVASDDIEQVLSEHKISPRKKSCHTKKQLPDHCRIREVSQVVSYHKTERAFKDDESAYQEFVNLLKSGKEEIALKKWLLSSDIFRGSDEGDLTVRGNRIFEIKNVKLNKSYIVKHTNCQEVETLWKINESIIAHPECLLNQHELNEKYAKVTSDDLKDLPVIAKVIDSVKYNNSCFALFERAPGESLSDLNDKIHKGLISNSDALIEYNSIGRKMSAQHYFLSNNIHSKYIYFSTWIHRDLHHNNVFYDRNTKQLTFIDNEDLDFTDADPKAEKKKTPTSSFMGKKSHNLHPEADIYRMHLASYRESFQNFLYYLNKELEPLIKERSIEINTHQYYELLKEVFKKQESNLVELSEKFNRNFKLSNAFIQGYLVHFPEPLKSEVRSYFSAKCQEALNEFQEPMSLNSKWVKVGAPPSEVLELLPTEFKRCLKGEF